MSHFRLMARRLCHSVRLRLGMLLVALVVLPSLFAEVLAADAPIVAIGPSGVRFLPAAVDPERYQVQSTEDIAAEHGRDAVLWPLVRSGPNRTTAAGPFASPSSEHPLGTDGSSRDVTARLVHGVRRTLGMTLLALLVALLVGGTVGAMGGQSGGFWDELMSRPVELIQAFPALVAVAVARAVDSSGSPWVFALGMAAVRAAEIARLVRGEVVRIGAEDHVLSAVAVGCTRRRIFTRYVLPEAIRPVCISLLFGSVSLALLEIAASFIGIGIDSTWGALIADGLTGRAPLGGAVAGVGVLAAFATGAYLLADSVDEAADARLAGRRRLIDRRLRAIGWRALSTHRD